MPELTTEEQVVLLTEVVATLHTRLQLLEAKAVALENSERETWAPYLRALGVNPNDPPSEQEKA